MLASHNIIKLFGTTAAVAAMGLGIQLPAAADTTDEAFLRAVGADALTFDLPEVLIHQAQVVCQAFSAGSPPATINKEMQKKLPLLPRQTGLFMTRAVQSYCPKYAGQLFG
ncbi:MAG: DUF732 domain-containing protein [Candidatus Sericytochromatia bacterium]